MSDIIKVPKPKIRKRWSIHPGTQIHNVKKKYSRKDQKKSWRAEIEDELSSTPNDGC